MINQVQLFQHDQKMVLQLILFNSNQNYQPFCFNPQIIKMEIKNTVLPLLPEDRLILTNRIKQKITKLQAQLQESKDDSDVVNRCQKSITRLKLRLNLIAKCAEISLLRLGHIEDVFRHYCMKVFRTGKHMTFDRLQYDRVHMTVERFCLFLRDFQATGAVINGKNCEILENPIIVATFRKVASNARELSFEEFIQCIDRLAVLHWDGTEGFQQKQQQREKARQKIKQANERRRKKKKGEKASQKQGEQKAEGEQEKQEDDAQDDQDQEQDQQNQQKAADNNQNDDLVKQLMDNQDIEDPNQEVRQLALKAKKQNAAIKQALIAEKNQQQQLLRLSKEEKIEFYYRSLDIDSVDSYKRKLTNLNLPYFQNHQQKNREQPKAMSESKLQAAQQEEARLRQLKAKMTEKMAKQKERPLPKPSNQKALKEEQNSRRRKQMRQQRESAVKQIKKVEQVRKNEPKKNATISYKDGEISWQILQKMGLDHLRLKQFNPANFYSPAEDDRYFLDQYGPKPKIASRLQAREKQSLSIVKDTRMRAEELQRKQKDRQRKSTQYSKNKY